MKAKIGLLILGIIFMLVGSAALVQAASTSTINIGTPYYDDGTNEWITSGTPIDFSISWTASPTTEKYFKYIIDGMYNTLLPPIGTPAPATPFNLNGETSHSISWRTAEDNPLYYEPMQTWDCILDNSAPTTTFGSMYFDGTNDWTTSSTPITLTADDGTGCGVKKTRYKVDTDPWQPYSTPLYLTNPGPYSIRVRSVDYLNWWETTQIHTVCIDDTAPTVTYIPPPNPGDYVSGTYTLTADVVDTGSGVKEVYAHFWTSGTWNWVKKVTFTHISGTIWSATVDTTTFPDPNGDYKFRIHAVDNVINNGNTGAIDPIHYDNTAPTTSIFYGIPSYNDGSNDWITTATPITLTADDGTGCGVKRIRYRIDTDPWQTYTTPFSFTTTGTHTISFKAVDNLNNYELFQTVTAIVDDTPPSSVKTYGTPFYYDGTDDWITSATPITLTAVDTGCGVRGIHYDYGAGPMFQAGSTATFCIPIDGYTYIQWYSEDNLGNDENPQGQYVYVDSSTPTTHIRVIPYKKVTLYADDLDGTVNVGFDKIHYRIKYIYHRHEFWTPWYSTANNPFYFGPLGMFDIAIEYYSTDILGNTETTQYYEF